MPDQRSVMKEFRLLDQKRASEGLAPAEEARYAQLRDLVGPEGAVGTRGGFDVDAAAARLRDSLVPAGARSRPAPAAPPIDPPADLSAGTGLGSALEAELFGPDSAPEAEPLFGDAPLDGPPGAEDAGAWGADAAGGFEAGAAEAFPQDGATAAWDVPAAPDDPNAQGWDPQQPLDPNAPAYDAAGAYDPGAQGWDAQQPQDPNVPPYDPGAQGWDPLQPQDPNAPAYDAAGAYDPGAQGWDAQQPQDPNAPPYDPDAQGWDAQQPWDPDAAPYGAEAPAPDAAAPWDPSAQGWADPQQPHDPNAAPFDAAEPAAAAPFDAGAPGWDPQQPYDPNAAPFAAWAPPQEAAAPFDAGAPGWDPQQPYDPGAAPFGAAEPAQDAGAPFDPGAGWDAQQPWEPGSAPGEQRLEESALSPWEAAQPGEPGAVGWGQAAEEGADGYADGAVATFEPGAEGFAATDAALSPEAAAAEPLDVAAEGAWDPHAALPEGAAPLYAEPEGSALAGEEGGWQTTTAADLLGEAGEDAAAEQEPAQPFTADLAALPPAGWDAEPAPAEMTPVDPSALGEYDGAASAPPEGEDGGLESMLPFDPASEAAVGPGHAPEGFPAPTGEYDDTAGFAAAFSEQAPPDLRSETSGFHAAQGVSPEDAPSWAPEGLDDGFELASGGSFDAAASAAIPEWAFAPEPDIAADPTQAFSLGAAAPGTAAPAAEAALSAESELLEVAPSAEAAPLDPLDREPGPAAPLLEPLRPEPATAVEGAAAPDADPAGELDDFAVDVELDLAADLGADHGAGLEPAPDATAELYAPVRAPAPVASAAPAPLAAAPCDDGADLAGPPDDAVDLAGPAPLLDFSQPDFSADDPAGDDAFATVPVAPAALRPAPAHLELEDHPAAAREEELPTLEGEEILEELPAADAPAPVLDFAPPPAPAIVAPPEPSAAAEPDPIPAPPPLAVPPAPAAAIAPPPPAPPPSEPCEVRGAHRVVVHTLEGQVKRGVLEDADLAAPALALVAQPGDAAEAIATESVKAIFFMLSPGEAAPPAQGKKVRVTFRDGRQVAGFSPEYREDGAGFFMVPVDTRTNTGRIWVYRAALRQVSVS